jgi:hypothetical protein
MKTILSILFVVMLTDSFAQRKLSGKFCHSINGGYTAVCIDFKESNRFEYVVTGDLGIESMGKGNYCLQRKNLKLNFEKDSTDFKSLLKIEKWEDKDRLDSIDLIFNIIEKGNTNEPIAGVILKEHQSGRIEKTFQTDSNGYLTMTKPRNQALENYSIASIGLERYEFTLTLDSTQIVFISLAPDSPKIISDQILILEMSQIKHRSFITKKGELYENSN